jgi:hypothetical protein
MAIALTHDVTIGESWKTILQDLESAALGVLRNYGWNG